MAGTLHTLSPNDDSKNPGCHLTLSAKVLLLCLFFMNMWHFSPGTHSIKFQKDPFCRSSVNLGRIQISGSLAWTRIRVSFSPKTTREWSAVTWSFSSCKNPMANCKSWRLLHHSFQAATASSESELSVPCLTCHSCHKMWISQFRWKR